MNCLELAPDNYILYKPYVTYICGMTTCYNKGKLMKLVNGIQGITRDGENSSRHTLWLRARQRFQIPTTKESTH